MHNQRVKEFFDQPTNYLAKSFGVRLRKRIVRESLGTLNNIRLLDIGCGDGAISLQYANCGNELTLIDLSPQMLALAGQNIPTEHVGKVTLLNIDLIEHSPSFQYNAIICLGVLAHVPSIGNVVQKIADLLLPGGRCVIQYTDLEQFASKINWWISKVYFYFRNPYQYPINPIRHQDILQLVEKYQLKLLNIKRYSLLLPGMGRFSDKFLYHYQLFSLQNQWVSNLSTDVILLLEKGN